MRQLILLDKLSHKAGNVRAGGDDQDRVFLAPAHIDVYCCEGAFHGIKLLDYYNS